MRRLLADTAPLRTSRQFRYLFIGQAGIDLGRQIANVAIPVQVYQLTRSSLMVGLVSLIQVAPLVLGALFGGSVADAVDRRRVLITIQCLMACAGVGLFANSLLASPRLWVIFALTAVIALLYGADVPTRNSLIPRLVDARHVAASFALVQVQRQTLHAAAPAVAGVLIAQLGISVTFGAYVVSFLAAGGMLARLDAAPPLEDASRAGLSSIIEGFRYLRTRPILLCNFGVDLQAMVFASPNALFPEFGTVVLGGDEATVGLLYSALGIGAMLGAVTSGWVSRVRRQGRAVMLAIAAWGCALIVFAFARVVWLAMLCIGVAGVANVISSVFRATILHLSISDQMRGRLTGIQTSVFASGPRFGEAVMGGASTVVGPLLAIAGGGTLCVLGVALIGRWVPRYWHYQAVRNTEP